jgi:uncharacterized protein (DUF433 family)
VKASREGDVGDDYPSRNSDERSLSLKSPVQPDTVLSAMVAAATNLLGIGLYTPGEAALYARVQTRLLNRWLFGSRDGEAVVDRQLRHGEGDRFVTFLDFVQALAVRDIRKRYGIPLQKIRDGIDRARREYGVPYPLAMKHVTGLYGGDLMINVGESQIQLTGREAGHHMLKPITELYMKDLSFDAHEMAAEYRAYQHGDRKITMNPKVRFGEPLLQCGYTARTLWEAEMSEGGIESAAEAYGVEPADVEAAVRYHDHLQGQLAA